MFPMRFVPWLAALLVALASSLALADPPARVGRISLLDGPVTFRTDRQDSGSAASVNWPISSGAILDTDRGARAEAWVGSSVARLGSESRIEFATVDDQLVAMKLAAGSLSLTVRDREQAGELEVTTPNGRIQFNAPGRYRIDVGMGRTNVSVHSGSAYVSGAERAVSVPAGRAAVLDANGGVALYAEVARDGFDDWAASRDAAGQAPTAARYVSPQMTGYQDLDSYGDWGSVPDYGAVWYPRAMPVGWAPYRYGRWAWVQPWGWTWVDNAPWGFAPFHYGRWEMIRGRWGWMPGSYAARPVYAPALVGWIGNPGWSVSFGVGSTAAVGWFPLAPREVYVPAYRSSPTYIRQVNVTQVTNVTVIDRAVAQRGDTAFAHRGRSEAVTVVPANTLREGSVITAASLQRPERLNLHQAPVSARAPDATWLPPPTAGERHRHEEAVRGAAMPATVPAAGGGERGFQRGEPERRFERYSERPAPAPGAPVSPQAAPVNRDPVVRSLPENVHGERDWRGNGTATPQAREAAPVVRFPPAAETGRDGNAARRDDHMIGQPPQSANPPVRVMGEPVRVAPSVPTGETRTYSPPAQVRETARTESRPSSPPAFERRVERPAERAMPPVSEPSRPREAAPPPQPSRSLPQPQAVLPQAREAARPEARPGGHPQPDGQGRKHEPGNGQN